MKRDPELVRALLLKLETYPLPFGAVVYFEMGDDELAIDGYEPDQIGYHARLLADAGFIDEPNSRPMNGFAFRGLTWAGHDFVDSVRDPEIWEKTKKGADIVRSWSIDTLKEIAKGLLKKQIEDYTGVKIG
jgi:hypothetical protein